MNDVLADLLAERDALRKRVERQDRCLVGLRERMKRYRDQRAALREALAASQTWLYEHHNAEGQAERRQLNAALLQKEQTK